MKFVATKTADQLDLQALHRVRERFVGQRTGIINQIRAFMLERGIAVRQGLRFLRAELPGILATRSDALSPRMLRILEDKGVVEFSEPPVSGTLITAGFLFDTPVRFAEDRLEINRATFLAGEAPSVPLIEVRED